MNYSLATNTWDDSEISAIQRVIDKGIFSMDQEVILAESEFSNYFDSKFCVMVNSGSSANLLAVAAMFYKKENPWKRGDEVIVPAVSWSTTFFPLYQYGLKLRFVDIAIDTLNIDSSELENAITENTRAIFAVNLLGNPCDFDKIMNLVSKYNLDLIEDNCESMGAVYKNRYTGTFGKIATFSSFFSHHIATMEGGYCLTDDEELYHIMLCLRAHGWTRSLPLNNFVTGTKKTNWFDESWNFVLPGYNLRPLEMSGAICRQQLKKLNSFIKSRRENAKYFIDLFNDDIEFIIQREVECSSWFGFSIIFKNSEIRNQVVSKFSSHGIDCRPIVAGNFTKNSVMKYLDYTIYGNLENSDKVDNCGLFIGNSHLDIRNKIQYAYQILKSMNSEYK